MLRKWLLTLLAATSAFATSITVSSSTTNQKVVGFGGGIVYYQNWYGAYVEKSDQQSGQTAKDLFDTVFTGLNLSLLRLGN